MVAADFADQRLYRLDKRAAPGALTPESERTAALRRSRAGSGARPDPRGARGPSRRRRGGQHASSRCLVRRRRGPGPGRGPRLLQLAPPQPRWPTARLAELGPSRTCPGTAPGCGLPKLPATAAWRDVRRSPAAIANRSCSPNGRRTAAVFRVRPQRLVEPLPRRSARPESPSARCLPNSPGRPGRSACAATPSSIRARSSPASARTVAGSSRILDVERRHARPAGFAVHRVLGACAWSGPRRAARRPSDGPAAIVLLDPASGGVTRAVHRGRPAGRAAFLARPEAIAFAARAACRPRLLLSADQSGFPRAGGRAAAADRQEPRRPDRQHLLRAAPLDPVLDLARLCRVRRQLRRQHRLRPRLSRAAERPLGRGRRGRLPERGALPGRGAARPTRAGSRSPAAAPAATPRCAR